LGRGRVWVEDHAGMGWDGNSGWGDGVGMGKGTKKMGTGIAKCPHTTLYTTTTTPNC